MLIWSRKWSIVIISIFKQYDDSASPQINRSSKLQFCKKNKTLECFDVVGTLSSQPSGYCAKKRNLMVENFKLYPGFVEHGTKSYGVYVRT